MNNLFFFVSIRAMLMNEKKNAGFCKHKINVNGYTAQAYISGAFNFFNFI